jgi:hypothetical protein
MIDPARLFKRGAITAESAKFLVGRRDLISDIGDRLAEDNFSAIIYGVRGVGKTTLAWQVISVLMNINSLFKRDDILHFGHDRSFEVIFHKCSPNVRTVGDLLIEIIRARAGEYSFGSVHEYVMRDTFRINRINRKFGIDILKVVNYSEETELRLQGGVSQSDAFVQAEALKREIFTGLMEEVRLSKPAATTIFVVDEIDRPTRSGKSEHIEGLGDYLKDNDHAQFLFVGIGESIDALIRDHRSSGRKLSGGDFLAPLLDNGDIEEIYHIAVREANGELSVSDDFLELVVQYSGGMPWIAQNTGYEAVRSKIRGAKPGQVHVRLEKDDFGPSLRRAMDVYRKDNEMQLKLSTLGSPALIDCAVLDAVWEMPSGISDEILRAKIRQDLRRWFDSSLLKLKDAGVLFSVDDKVFFTDEIIRIYTRFLLDGQSISR